MTLVPYPKSVKLVEAKPDPTDPGQAEGFKRVLVVVELDGKPTTGHLDFEIDGRDIEVGGDLEDYDLNWEAIWDDEAACEMLNKAMA